MATFNLEDIGDLVLQSDIPQSKVELAVSARDISEKNPSKSYPMCVLFTREVNSTEYIEYNRTEIIDKSTNPDFLTKFTMDFFFERRQHLKFELYDVDKSSTDLNKHFFLGEMTCTLAEIMNEEVFDKGLKGRMNGGGAIQIRGEELTGCKNEMTISFRGERLDSTNVSGKSNPFLTFHRTNDDGTYTICGKTEHICNTFDPNWKRFTVMLKSFCRGDNKETIKVTCWDWNTNGSHSLIGEFYTTVEKLSKGLIDENTYQLIHPEKRQAKNYLDSGLIILTYIKIEPQASFLDYVKDGCKFQFTIAIDFTDSNGNPKLKTSRHFMNPNQTNDYMRAVKAAGEILEVYCADNQYLALGFGAKVSPNEAVSHDFYLNGKDNPMCSGIPGVIEAYKNTLHKVTFFGPTHFAPIINHVARLTREKLQDTKMFYHILLIVTDGCINDLAKARKAVVEAAELPISIVIVGVGNDDFKHMVELDGDKVRVSYRGQEAKRDIVQFVPFQQIYESTTDEELRKANLAREVLEEIPDQILSYMKMSGFNPSRRLSRST